MGAQFKLVDLNISLELPRKSVLPLDWQKCFNCQTKINGEELVNPQNIKRLSTEDAYSSLAKNLEGFANFHKLPEDVNLKVLQGDFLKLEESLRKNGAVYHKKCSLKFNSTKLDRIKCQKRSPDQENIVPPSPAKTRKSLNLSPYEKDTCLFCGLGNSRVWPLSKIQEHGSKAIQKCAVILRDSKILTMCERGLREMMYHKKCYSNYLNRIRSQQKENSTESCAQSQAHGVVLARLISHMHEVRIDSPVSQPPAFKMSQLARIYGAEMEELGVSCDVHSTRLRERLLQECPELESTGKCGQDILIACRRDIDWTIRDSCRRDYDDEGCFLSRSADIIRKDLFSDSQKGHREPPISLKYLCKMILQGPALRSEEQTEEDFDQIVNSMADLMAYHAVKKVQGNGKFRRHNSRQDTPTPVYVATKLYGETRKKDLVEIYHSIGLSISYDRLQIFLDEAAEKTSLRYMTQGVVCPEPIGRKRFVTAAADNLDHNPSSTTARSAYHGTAISIMQHPIPDISGEVNDTVSPEGMPVAVTRRGAKFALPLNYENVKESYLDPRGGKCPAIAPCARNDSVMPFALEKGWLEACRSAEHCTTWSDFHSESDKRKPEGKEFSTQVSVLPLFHEKAPTMSMMEHAMKVVQAAVKYLNPGQIPVMTVDQPLYALCKSAQWQVNDLDEQSFFVMFGAMHIELAALRVLGQWLNESGWVDALLESGVATEGRAKSMIHVSHLARTRYAHEVTAAALYRLQVSAFEQGVGDIDDPMTFDQWRQKRRGESLQFLYWDIAMELELTVLLVVKSLRCADFDLYVAALRRLVPWFFSLNHTHYSRWLSVHIPDLENLEVAHPALYQEFRQGKFVARLSERIFSGLALDQCHEQQNARLKGDGGMIGLIALKKWMLATPELVKLNSSFEENLDRKRSSNHKHHRSTASAKQTFLKDVSAMESVIHKMSNPFLDEGKDLFNISSHKVCAPEVGTFVTEVEEIGVAQYAKFCEERLQSNAVGVHDKIKENKIYLFNTAQRQVPKMKEQIKSLKEDNSLWSRLYVATSGSRPSELDEFFSHENTLHPPSLSLPDGSLRTTDKSELVKSLVELTKVVVSSECPAVDAKILDGAAMVNMVRPEVSVTFDDYVHKQFFKFLENESKTVKRVDIVWDRYYKDSLKGMTREKRGEGCRLKVSLTTKAVSMSDDMFDDLLGEQAIDNPSSNSDGTPLEFSGVDGPTHQPPHRGVQDVVKTAEGFVCPICSKTLKTKSTFTRHYFLHTINDYNARKPFEDEIKTELMSIFSGVLDDIRKEPAVGVMDHEKISFVQALIPAIQTPKCVEVVHELSKPLIDSVLTRTKVVPSGQLEQALQKVQHILSDPSFVQNIWGKLLLCVPDEENRPSKEVGHRLVWRICTAMLNRFQEIVFQKMIKHHQTAVSTFTMSEEDKLAFKDHVGSLLRSIFRVGAKSSNSVWHERCQVLRLRFVCGDVQHENFDDRNLWKSGSVVLSDACLNLFYGLERLIQSNKDKACSADFIFNSLTNIENHLILNDMRHLSRGFLSEDSALSFLQDIIKSYCATSCELEARRIVSQRKNAATVSLRTNLKRNPKQKPTSDASTVQAQAQSANIAVAIEGQEPAGDIAGPSTSCGRKGQSGNVGAAVKGQVKMVTPPAGEVRRSQKQKGQSDTQKEVVQSGPSTRRQKKSGK
ncbi:Microtubule-associated protein VP7 [Frankliniella fusca]|uniref:Microtubule-associated protein VP7 n=1 Tax=Frankliniella fusca TaxID=407009 RepID=A0AAE1GWF0_9NEOP|nr:Microtubule-associated protein VP7 [Frankliniella fusca]